MASFVIGEDTVRLEKQRKEMENIEKSRRHYKKDSRLVETGWLAGWLATKVTNQKTHLPTMTFLPNFANTDLVLVIPMKRKYHRHKTSDLISISQTLYSE